MGKTLGRLRRLPEIECLFPKSIEEAFSFLEKHNGTAKVIAGGTDLIPKMKRRALTPKYLIDLRQIPDLNFIKYDEKDGLRIGATTTLAEIKESPVIADNCPVLVETVSQMASTQIRNLGTIGGNLCNAIPSADLAPPLIVLRARVKLVGPKKERTVLVEEFFEGPEKTVIKPFELLTEVQIPLLLKGESATYLKHSLRAAMDLAIVGVAAFLSLDSKKQICNDVRIALGAVAPTPLRAKRAEEVLKGKALVDDDLIENAANLASEESKPIDDIRSSAEYRREMVKVLTNRAIKQCLANQK